jgi:hypothetical protein
MPVSPFTIFLSKEKPFKSMTFADKNNKEEHWYLAISASLY